jgi:hypothetical protein
MPHQKDSESPLRHARCQMIVDILYLMEKKKDLPLPNIHRLCKVIIEYYKKEGFKENLRASGSKWDLSIFYIRMHMKDIKEISTENYHPFAYHRPKDSLRGLWMFLNKKQYTEILSRELKELETRKETYNKMLEDGNDKMKYNIKLPRISDFSKINSPTNETKLLKEK